MSEVHYPQRATAIKESLGSRVFETWTATLARTVMSPRFLYYLSLMEKMYLAM